MSKILTTGLLAALCAFGFYGTFGAAGHNGLLPAILTGNAPEVQDRYCPGGPAPFKNTYTGIEALDSELRGLICFFVILIDAPKTKDVSWVARYLALQLLAGWLLVSLEGLRRGNRGRIVSWTGTLGAIFQRLTYTVMAPLYLIVHLFTSPMSNKSPTLKDVSIDADDLATLPLVTAAAYVVPTIIMALPSPELISPYWHYSWSAIWQFFPVLQSISHFLVKRLIVRPLGIKSVKIGNIYRLVLAIAVVSQSTLLILAITPPGSALDKVNYHPGITSEIFAQVDFSRAFIPYWPWNTPVVAKESIKATGEGLAELVKLFLQWDIYCGGLSVLVWSIHVYLVTCKTSLLSVVPKVAFWTVLGGPAGAAAVLLEERDIALQKIGDKKTR